MSKDSGITGPYIGFARKQVVRRRAGTRSWITRSVIWPGRVKVICCDPVHGRTTD